MKRLGLVLLLILSLTSSSPIAVAAIGSPAISSAWEFEAGAYPSGLVYGPQQAFWLTLLGKNQVADFQPPATVTLTQVTTQTARLFDITIGPDQNLWFTQQLGNQISSIRPLTRQVASFALPTPQAYPAQITLGQDGGLWFTELEANRLGRTAPSGAFSEYLLPNANSKPLGITSDLDGNLWFTEWNGYRIGKLTPQGELVEYTINSPPARPTEIALGPDGKLWFIYEIGRRVVRVDPLDGAMTTYLLPITSTSLADLAIGPDGRLWFLGIQTIGSFAVGAHGPEAIQEIDIADIFQGQGRSQVIAGSGGTMNFITASSQHLYEVGPISATLRDLQVFITAIPQYLLSAGEFELAVDVVNWSSDAAANLKLELTLDESIEYLGADAPGGSCAQTGSVVTCNWASLAGATTLPVTFTLKTTRIQVEEVQRVLALKATSNEGDYLPANNRTFRFISLKRAFKYFNDFTFGSDQQWSHDEIKEANGLKYLGIFGNDRVTLSFDNIPPHDEIELCFDLYVLGSWDGSRLTDPGATIYPPPVIGPDLWSLYMDDDRRMVTTFSNTNLQQAFPAFYPDDENNPRSGAVETGDFDGAPGVTDARYRFCQTVKHTAADFTATFFGLNLDELIDEGWGLDNVSLKIYFHAVFDWLYLPLMAR